MKKIRVGLVFGGKSGEHEVSIMSAESIYKALNKNRFEVEKIKIEKDGGFELSKILECDVIFPIVHGSYGEDGCLQGLLEMYDMAYVGAGVLGSALGMDKEVQKRLLMQAGIKVAKFENVKTFPCFVKPANMGSSVGISKASNKQELEEAISLARKYDTK